MLHKDGSPVSGATARPFMAIDDKIQIELEAAAFRRLVDHLRGRTDVQNIDLDEPRRLLSELLVKLAERGRCACQAWRYHDESDMKDDAWSA